MIDLQLDTIDVFARDMVPTVVSLATSMKRYLPKDSRLDLEQALHLYRDFDGDMAEDSSSASLHMHYQLALLKSLFHK